MDNMLLTFYNTHHTITAEQILINIQICVKVMPMPEAITAGCGLCLRLEEKDVGTACTVLKKDNILPRGIYKEENGSYMEMDLLPKYQKESENENKA